MTDTIDQEAGLEPGGLAVAKRSLTGGPVLARTAVRGSVVAVSGDQKGNASPTASPSPGQAAITIWSNRVARLDLLQRGADAACPLRNCTSNSASVVPDSANLAWTYDRSPWRACASAN